MTPLCLALGVCALLAAAAEGVPTTNCESGDCVNGQGVLRELDGSSTYEGGFLAGLKHGKGKITITGRSTTQKAGDTIECEWSEGVPSRQRGKGGSAVYTTASGVKYEGEFTGTGTLATTRSPHGEKKESGEVQEEEEGQSKEGGRVPDGGHGALYGVLGDVKEASLEEGIVYSGQLLDGVPQGRGRMEETATNSVLEGQCKCVCCEFVFKLVKPD